MVARKESGNISFLCAVKLANRMITDQAIGKISADTKLSVLRCSRGAFLAFGVQIRQDCSMTPLGFNFPTDPGSGEEPEAISYR